MGSLHNITACSHHWLEKTAREWCSFAGPVVDPVLWPLGLSEYSVRVLEEAL